MYPSVDCGATVEVGSTMFSLKGLAFWQGFVGHLKEIKPINVNGKVRF